jgi:uncharacterized protein (TIGR04222 family)
VNPVRRFPAVALVALLAILPVQAWFRVARPPVVVHMQSEGLRGIVWSATVVPDGRLAVSVAYELADDRERTIDVRVPPGARQVTVDGRPITTSIGRYGTATGHGTITVAYQLPGRIRRFADGAVLDRAGVRGDEGDEDADGDDALFPCPSCYLEPVGYGKIAVQGLLRVPGADASAVRLAVAHLGQLRADVSARGDVARFVGVARSIDAVALLARRPADAVPDAPIEDGRADDAFAAARADARAAGLATSTPSDRGGLGAVATAVLLTGLLALLAAWIAGRLIAAARDRAGDDEPPEATVTAPPDDLEPALVGLVVGTAGRGDRSVVAGSLLALASRRVVRLAGLDSERFTLTVPVGAQGATPFEEAVLAALRPQGQVSASATLTGPPLWGEGSGELVRRLHALLLREGRRRDLVRVTLSALVLVPAALAMGVIAVIGSEGSSVLAWLAAVGGPILAVLAALLTGVSLTRAGRRERRSWRAYAAWLRTNAELADVGAPGVAVWGDVLAYGAVLGAAPAAARALSPR